MGWYKGGVGGMGGRVQGRGVGWYKGGGGWGGLVYKGKGGWGGLVHGRGCYKAPQGKGWVMVGGLLQGRGGRCFSFGVQTSGEYISTMFGCI